MTCMTLQIARAKLTAVAVFFFSSMLAIAGQAETFDSGCSDRYFSRFISLNGSETVFDRTAVRVHGIDESQNFYSASEGGTPTGQHTFAAEYAVTDPGLGFDRLLVRDVVTGQEIGWADKESILCREVPLRDPDTGLWRRAFIQTATRSVGSLEAGNQGDVEVEAKPLHRGPNALCDDGCHSVGLFEWYYIYGESNGRVLISKAVNLVATDRDPLAGWLQDSDSIQWNTANALRPAIDLDERDPAYLCAYVSLEDLRAERNCREFLGGLVWFEIDLRLPIVDETEEAWQVIFKAGGNNLDRGELLDALNNESRRGNVASGLRNLDVIFLIDGTKSVAPAIEAIKGANGRPGIVDQLRESLGSKLEEGGKFRAGFRVFRDSVQGGGNGMRDQDSLPLNGMACDADNAEFFARFRSVDALDINEDNDFEENLLGGLQQAVRDIGGCRDHSKLVIVIGDHGYSPDAQRARRHRPVTVEQVRSQLQSSATFETPPLVFFVQLPKADMSRIMNVTGYENAYDGYETIAKQFIRLQAQHYGRNMDPALQRDLESEMLRDMFIRLPAGRVTEVVVERIAEVMGDYLQPTLASQFGRGGVSIEESIRRLQEDSDGVPMLWWGMAEERFCAQIPEQCTENILDKVDMLYVKKSDGDLLVPEILMTRQQMSDWINLLGDFRKFRGEQILTGLRDALEGAVDSQFGIMVGNPLHPTEGRPMTLGEILQLQGGLPSGMTSKLLAYTPEDFAPQGLPPCEIRELAEMAGRRFGIFQELSRGQKLPQYETKSPNPSQCPTLSPTGRSLEIVDFETQWDLVLSDVDEGIDRSYMHAGGGTQQYWIPLSYIP